VGFQVVVIDNRSSFARQECFPEADAVICSGFADALSDYPVDEETYVVVMTRGHRHDLECVGSVMGRGAGFLAMVASRRRAAGVVELLRVQGRDDDAIAELHSPAGLDIGSETPEEIALSILAQVVKARRVGGGRGPGERRSGANGGDRGRG